MIQDHAMLNGIKTTAALATTAISDSLTRQHVIHLVPKTADTNPGYVWRRVFLKSRIK